MKSGQFTLADLAKTVLFLTFSVILISCKKEKYMDCDELNAISEKQSFLSQLSPFPNPTNIGDPVTVEDNGMICVSQKVKWAPSYDEMFLLDTKSDVFYPGSIIRGESITTGGYTPTLDKSRLPITISINLKTKPGEVPFEKVEDPNLSSVRAGINKLLERVEANSTPADLKYEIAVIRSEEELALQAGVNFNNSRVKLSGSFGFSTQEQKSRILIKFYQKYYTISVDPITSPCDFFDLSNELLEADYPKDVSPAYISTVSYGRLVYFMIESSAKADSISAALNLAIGGKIASGSASLSVTQSKMIEESKITALVKGGSSDYAVKTVSGLNALLDYITIDGDFSTSSPGLPIAYSMRYLKEPIDVTVVLSSEYTVTTCGPKPIEMEVTPNNNNSMGYNYCANWVSGNDRDFAGNGPLVAGTVRIFAKNETEIFAAVNFSWNEQYNQYPTVAEVKEEFHLFTLPPGRKFLGFGPVISGETLAELKSYITYTDNNHGIDIPPVTGDDIIENIYVVGDTSGKDLECNGHEDANVLFRLKPFKIQMY